VRVLIDYRSALRSRSGVGEYVHRLVHALAQINRPDSLHLDLTLFSSSWKDRLNANGDLPPVRVVDRRIPVALLNFAWHRLEWPTAESLANGNFDVTHSMHPLMMPSRSAAQVITIHDLNFLSHPERTRAEIRRDYPPLARSHAHRADAIIVPSRFTATEVERRLEVPPERIVVCSPGAPDWAPRAAATKGGYILFFGTLEPRKNVGALLDAYERLVTRRSLPELVLAGQATDEAAKWLERIARPPLAGTVRHIGYVEPGHRRQLYEGARILVQPSFEEGFGIPVLEAMTIGVPVVAASKGALPEVLGDAGLLFEPDDPEALAAALERVLSDEPLAAANVAKGVARARHFRWSETAATIAQVYQHAIEHKKSRIADHRSHA
jgi:glycosyltransferase involved in cell wall biosynthesis